MIHGTMVTHITHHPYPATRRSTRHTARKARPSAYTMAPAKKVQEFVAHGSAVNCVQIGRKSGSVMVTGGDDKKVNVWALGKTNAIMVGARPFRE